MLAEYLNIESLILNLPSVINQDGIGIDQLFLRVVKLCSSIKDLAENGELNRIRDSPISDEVVRLRLICIKEMAAESENWYIVLSKECNDIGLQVIENLEKLV